MLLMTSSGLDPIQVLWCVTWHSCGSESRRQEGMGLVGMATRIKHLVGSFEMYSQLCGGAASLISLPLPEMVAA